MADKGQRKRKAAQRTSTDERQAAVAPHPYNLRQALASFERRYLQNILVLAEGDAAAAARMFGISRPTLARKLRQYALAEVAPNDVRPRPPPLPPLTGFEHLCGVGVSTSHGRAAEPPPASALTGVGM